jgi:hypothetical protein
MLPNEAELEERGDGVEACIARGEILRLVRRRQREQKHRMDHVALWHILRDIGFNLGEYEVKTYLQDLQASGLVAFDVDEEPKFLRKTLVRIVTTARGVAVLERRIKDDCVTLL